jgi:glycosyltransferase domain-containing protein
MDISIVIPTMNRPKMLLRLIKYFDLVSYRGTILIGDSSDASTFQEAVNSIEIYRGRIDIQHIWLPGLSVGAAIRRLNEKITTRYVCLVPDDDFIVPKTMVKCIQFLDTHPDYVGAHGLGAMIVSTGDSASLIDNSYPYRQTVAEEASAKERLTNHLEKYSVSLFSVFRSDIWNAMFIDTPDASEWPRRCDHAFVNELLPCCLSVIFGKIKEIDGLHVVRQVHGSRYLLPSWFLWLTNEKWYPSYEYFRNCLARAIFSVDEIAISDSEQIVDRLFSRYLGQYVAERGTKINWVFGLARKSSAIRLIWRALNDFRDRVLPGRRLSLASLLSPSSPYSEDFLPIYKVVVAENIETH